MAQAKLSEQTLLESVRAYREVGNQRGACKLLGISQPQMNARLKEARKRGLFRDHDGSVEPLQAKEMDLPRKGKVTSYILTCVQNWTKLHPSWADLLALAEHDESRILVSTFKYNKDALGQRANAKYDSREQELQIEYPAEVLPFICDERLDIAPNLTFCGELNILPTADDPLTGLESYTHRRSTVVPHPKLALQSVPTMPGEGVKLMYTTGCMTMRNYIKRKVGYKAESFHNYGALLVEVDSEGSWWCRQLTVGPDGAIHDLNRRVKNGKVEYDDGDKGFVVDICFGDAHIDKSDEEVARASWSKDSRSMLEVLHPKTTHVHDLLDMGGRSHHLRRDPHEVFRSFVHGKWELTQELRTTAYGLWHDIARPWCETVVVNSNHDRHLNIFLKEVDWRDDPTNAIAILKLNTFVLEAIRDNRKVNLLEHALGLFRAAESNGPVRFLAEDESDIILPNIDGGIEAGLHGDRGANGAKGTITGFAKLDRKVNGADKHTAAIMNHAFFAGTSAKLDMGFNKGLTSWTHAHVVTYRNGTRAIVSIWKGKWRA